MHSNCLEQELRRRYQTSNLFFSLYRMVQSGTGYQHSICSSPCLRFISYEMRCPTVPTSSQPFSTQQFTRMRAYTWCPPRHYGFCNKRQQLQAHPLPYQTQKVKRSTPQEKGGRVIQYPSPLGTWENIICANRTIHGKLWYLGPENQQSTKVTKILSAHSHVM